MLPRLKRGGTPHAEPQEDICTFWFSLVARPLPFGTRPVNKISFAVPIPHPKSASRFAGTEARVYRKDASLAKAISPLLTKAGNLICRAGLSKDSLPSLPPCN